MIFILHDTSLQFPNPANAEPDGLLAIGGNLSTALLLAAYHNGIFPWFSEDEPICWYAPPERCVIFPEKIFISKSMQKIMGSGLFRITMNTAFEQVIRNCKQIERREGPGTWITDEMEAAYIKLHKLGVAQSIEVWHEDELVGGLYGVIINHVFCGESMFSKMRNASKAALIWLCTATDFKMIDCQLRTDHLISMGAEMIGRKKYVEILTAETQPR